MEKNDRVELLSPAGNAAGFYGAVHAGADAVYLAGNQFGARAYAENFTTEELLECIRYGHLLGRKIYLTVNTLLKNQEMKLLQDYLAPLYEAGLDAVIVQDLGVLRFIRERFPGLKLHVSTQMTICSRWGGLSAEGYGRKPHCPRQGAGPGGAHRHAGGGKRPGGGIRPRRHVLLLFGTMPVQQHPGGT